MILFCCSSSCFDFQMYFVVVVVVFLFLAFSFFVCNKYMGQLCVVGLLSAAILYIVLALVIT